LACLDKCYIWELNLEIVRGNVQSDFEEIAKSIREVAGILKA